MQTSDRLRFLRGFGLAAGAVLLVSGAVLASQANLPADRASDDLASSADAVPSPEASTEASPDATGMFGGELADDASESPAASADTDEPGDDDAAESPGASPDDADTDEPGDHDAAESPGASPDDADEDGDRSGPDGHDDHDDDGGGSSGSGGHDDDHDD